MKKNLFNSIENFKLNKTEDVQYLLDKFDPLFNKYARYLKDSENAKGELVLTFFKLINNMDLSKFPDENHILSCINTSIKNKFYSSLKKQHSENLKLQKFIQFNSNFYEDFNSNIIFCDLISTLPIESQNILKEKFLLGLSNTKISKHHDISKQTLNYRINSSLHKISKILS
ncbi:MAG: sigma-70 family RNA polymerase sigma factor [Sarcina sp.]